MTAPGFTDGEDKKEATRIGERRKEGEDRRREGEKERKREGKVSCPGS